MLYFGMASLRGFFCAVVAFCSLARVTLGNLYNDNPYVVPFDEVNQFSSEVAESDRVWMIQFFSPSDSSSQYLVQQYSTVGMITRGIMFVGAVDATTDAGQEIAKKHGIKTTSLPAIYLFGDDPKPKKYTGKGGAQEMIQEMIQMGIQTMQTRAGGSSSSQQNNRSSSGNAGSSKVVELTSANFKEQVLDSPLVSAVAFTAPWCGHCKKLHPDWEEAARKLDGEGAFLGWVDATEENQLATMFQVQGYPTIKLFPGGAGKTYADGKDYQGGRSVPDIVQAVLDEVERSGFPKPVPELTSEDVLRENCAEKNHICVLAALPHILDSGAEGRNGYKDAFAKVAKTFRGYAFSFLWFEGTSQPNLEETLDMTFGFPAVAAFSMDKEAFVVMRSSFTEKNIASFLHGVTSGRQRTAKVSSMPKVETTEPWDGKDGAHIEEEIPLCEVMGTCDDEEGEF